MKIGTFRFNTYFALAIAVIIGAGCASSKSEDGAAAKKKHKRREVVLKLHLEINRDGTQRVGTATVGRSAPFTISVEKQAFLTELQVVKAELIDALGTYSIGLQFDEKGTWILDQYSTANKGRHFAVWAEYGEIRWIAAPKITQRLSTGRFVFTPDVTREDAETIVDGLNYVAEKISKGRK